MATLSSDPFEALLQFQRALDTFRTSGWLGSSLSGSGGYPPLNVFRKGDDLVIVTEIPGVNKSDLQVQVKGNTIRIGGTKAIQYGEGASLHRRERLAGNFDRAITLPVEIDANKAAYIAQLNAANLFQTPIVTTIEPGKEFYPAEPYHQDYLTLHPHQPYIAINDLPKIQALKELYPDSYRETPVLVAAVPSAK